VDRLAALDGGQEKGMKNRLRRAFSFGSAAELRKASAANSIRGEEIVERARLRQEKFREEQIAEQERVARRQEASGLGESIYSIQGNFFAGSTDNVSVSSTASSASIMIRKMGHGIKKSSRSLVGLFRPKSVVGVEAASGPIGAAQPSTGQISMITVEAERERVNVNANVAEHTDGGTGFPKLERNSLDMGVEDRLRRGSTGDESGRGRRSIVGGEKERAEVLAAVRKGILKRMAPVACNMCLLLTSVQVLARHLQSRGRRTFLVYSSCQRVRESRISALVPARDLSLLKRKAAITFWLRRSQEQVLIVHPHPLTPSRDTTSASVLVSLSMIHGPAVNTTGVEMSLRVIV
jgi:hypothetical protein